MRPSFSLPFMNNQPVSPVELLAKLSNIKSANETSNMKLKQIRDVEQKMVFYQTYSMETVQNLSQRLKSLNREVSELKRSFKKAQDLGVLNFDRVQQMLQNTLDEYESDRKRGQQMVEKMLIQIRDKLQRRVLQKSIQSSQMCEQYLRLSNRLQSVIESLESMQSQLLSQYINLKAQIKQRLISLQRSLLEQIQNTVTNSQALVKKIQRIEQYCNLQIERINERKEQRRYKLHQIMQKIIQQAVTNQQGQDQL